MSVKKRCLYKVLEVSQNASKKAIRDAYVAKTKKIHPDKNIGNPELHERFVELNQAYSILRDSAKRSEYDQEIQNPVQMTQTDVQASAQNPFGNQRYRSGMEGSTDHEDFYHNNPYTANNFKNYQFTNEPLKNEGKLSNKLVIALVIGFMFVGAGISFAHVVYIRKICKVHEEKVHQESSSFYELVREKARMNGPRKQLQLLTSATKDPLLPAPSLPDDNSNDIST